MINFVGPAKRLDDIDLPRIGAEIGVGEDEIHAVIDTETAGSGFDHHGRPAILFEPHIFYRQLKGAARDRAVAEGLAYPHWKRDYPADSYPRLQKAMAIDESAALKSASWGLGQILGTNFSLAGYDTIQAMVIDFTKDEDNHLQAMVTFIVSAGLDDELRRHDWRGFARGYNGAQYAKNNYHVRLAAAFAKWAKIKDTPYDPAAAKATADAADAAPAQAIAPTTAAGNDLLAQVKRLQQDLATGGADPGGIDGQLGRQTLMALQHAQKLPITGRINNDTFAALRQALA